MTRLDSKMPYDITMQAIYELDLLFADLKNSVVERLRNIRKRSHHKSSREDFQDFAKYCVENQFTCITFNYDDIFDEELWRVKSIYFVDPEQGKYWHPDGGYGFFCRPSTLLVREHPVEMDYRSTSMYLLKLHGSMNWRLKLGCPQTFMADWLVHYESWASVEDDFAVENIPARPETQQAERHLEREPFIVPPVLTKSGLVEQPVLRLIWSLAHQVLKEATQVTFIGYSLPATDTAAGALLREAIHTKDIRIVNLAKSPEEKGQLRRSYEDVLGKLEDDQFYWGDASVWAAERQYEM